VGSFDGLWQRDTSRADEAHQQYEHVSEPDWYAIRPAFGAAIWSAYGAAIWSPFGAAIWSTFEAASWHAIRRAFGAAIW
jgi:hypothetical protein